MKMKRGLLTESERDGVWKFAHKLIEETRYSDPPDVREVLAALEILVLLDDDVANKGTKR